MVISHAKTYDVRVGATAGPQPPRRPQAFPDPRGTCIRRSFLYQTMRQVSVFQVVVQNNIPEPQLLGALNSAPSNCVPGCWAQDPKKWAIWAASGATSAQRVAPVCDAGPQYNVGGRGDSPTPPLYNIIVSKRGVESTLGHYYGERHPNRVHSESTRSPLSAH